MSLFKKMKEADRRYYIYFNFGAGINGANSSEDLDLGELKLEHLTLEQAKVQLLKIKKKIEDKKVDVIGNGKELLIWGAINMCWIREE